ncbi:MAG: hypothetical protein H7Y43_02815 [Akkermansiaceae bacterium]|nr:hypothetical protein [Verrucomicrobiales bacterium]
MSKLPAGNVREMVLQACLEPLSEWDLAGSVALAVQLANPSARLKHIQPVLEKWFARQPEATRTWIGKSSFSEEIKASWLTGSFAVEAVPAPASEK